MQQANSMTVRPKIGRPPSLEADKPLVAVWEQLPGWHRRRQIALGAMAAAAFGLLAAFLAAQKNEGATSQQQLTEIAPAAGSAIAKTDTGVTIQSKSGNESLSGSMVVVGAADASLVGSEPHKDLSPEDKQRLLEIISRH